jgi:hypothetical protein
MVIERVSWICSWLSLPAPERYDYDPSGQLRPASPSGPTPRGWLMVRLAPVVLLTKNLLLGLALVELVGFGSVAHHLVGALAAGGFVLVAELVDSVILRRVAPHQAHLPMTSSPD